MSDYAALLLEASTPKQKALIQYLIDNPGASHKSAGVGVGLGRGTVSKTLSRLRNRLARKDPALHCPPSPGAPIPAEGFPLKGVSSLVDPRTGEVKLQWIKTQEERDKDPLDVLAAFREAIELSDIPARAPLPPSHPEPANEDLLAVIPMGDPHLGLVAWAKESGIDYDTDQCARHLRQAVEALIRVMPPTGTALLINLGDMFHSDNKEGVTARSGHSLDVDPRWTRVAVIAVDTMCYMIDRLLGHHAKVVVDNRIGNHDDHSSWMLSLCLASRYRDNPRVDIVCDPSMFWHYEFGKVLIGSTHGHGCKMDRLQGVMSTDWPEAWGRTKYRHWYTGHVHHEVKKEFAGCTAESFRSLTAKDAWSAGAGLRAGRSICADIWHRTQGLKMRHVVGVESLDTPEAPG